METNLYEQYAILDAEIKALESKKDELKSQIIKDLVNQGVEKIETTIGKFTVSKLKKWTYPQYVTEANEQYKALKAKAESTGEASYVEDESLRYTPIKL